MKKVTFLECSEFDELVKNTYGRIYSFQQQEGCKDRGIFKFSLPCKEVDLEDFPNDEIEEVVNGDDMGVSFKAWLKRDPKEKLPNQEDDWELDLFWKRNFYPDPMTLLDDMYDRRVLEAGDYIIEIDW